MDDAVEVELAEHVVGVVPAAPPSSKAASGNCTKVIAILDKLIFY